MTEHHDYNVWGQGCSTAMPTQPNKVSFLQMGILCLSMCCICFHGHSLQFKKVVIALQDDPCKI